MSILDYLHSKGMQTKPAGSQNVHTACVFCNEAPNKRGRLYINIDDNAEIPGLMMCHLCNERGSLNKLKRHFGDPTDSKEEAGENRLGILAAAAEYYKSSLISRSDVLGYLRESRGLSDETIDSFGLGWGAPGLLNHLVGRGFSVDEIRQTGLITKNDREFLERRIVIPYFSAGNVVLLRGRAWGEANSKYVTPPSQTSRIFNLDAVWKRGDDDQKKEIFIVEGEFDAIVMTQLGYRCVGLPGAMAWQESWGDYFNDFKRVFVVFDNDSAGISGSLKVSEALGGKARCVSLPQGVGDVTEFIVDQRRPKDELDDIIRSASGSILVSVREAFDEWSWLQGQSGLKFNVPLLDWAINPGLLPGQLMIPLAKSGVGKSQSLLNLMTGVTRAQPKAKILLHTLEQTRGDWFERARRIHGFHNPDLAPKHMGDLERFRADLHASTIEYWQDRLMLVDKNRVTEEDLVSSVEDFEERMGDKPDLICIDYLGYWANSFRAKDKYEQTSKAVMALKAIAKDLRIPIIAPGQLNRSASQGEEPDIDHARDSGVIVETADFVLAMWTTDTGSTDAEERTGGFHMRLGKSRHGNKGALVNMQFGLLSLVMVPTESADAMFARKEAEYILERKSWEFALMKHAGG